MLHILTGEGKSKTTAAIGMAVRAAGHGQRVKIIQFCKGAKEGYYGEFEFFKQHYYPNISFVQYGEDKIITRDNITNNDRIQATLALETAIDCITADRANMLILDEINIALDLGLLNFIEMVEPWLFYARDAHEIVLTGRNAHPGLIEMAEYATEMKEIKHPYSKGVQARRGIEN